MNKLGSGFTIKNAFDSVTLVKLSDMLRFNHMCKMLWNLQITNLKGHQSACILNSSNIMDANMKVFTFIVKDVYSMFGDSQTQHLQDY